ncbi:MAG: hypothetical protein IJ868_06115 [Prevotella sp.]|nr:hypothetical protein [Prevotella sp.]
MKKKAIYQSPFIRVVELELSSDVMEGIVITSYEGEFDVKGEMNFDDETASEQESSSNISSPSVWDMAWD